MAKATTYFIVERDPDAVLTDARHETIFKNIGAADNLTLKKSGDNILVELDDAKPPFWVISSSGSPIDH